MVIEPAQYAHNLQLTLPEGDEGVLSTLWVMRAAIDDAVESGGPVMRLATRLAVAAGKQPADQMRAVYDFLRDVMTFKRDALALEHVRHPDQLALEIMADGATAGDCDDVATLGAALLRAMGIKPGLVVASMKPGGAFHHVLFAGLLPPSGGSPGQWVWIDPQEGHYGHPPAGLTRTHLMSWE